MVSFFIDPSAAKGAVLSSRGLLVEVWGQGSQYRRVTVMERPKSDEPLAKSLSASPQTNPHKDDE